MTCLSEVRGGRRTGARYVLSILREFLGANDAAALLALLIWDDEGRERWMDAAVAAEISP